MGIATLLAWNSREVALAYTDNLDTVPVLQICLQTCGFNLFLAGATLSFQGSLKALKRQKIASKVLLISMYAVSLPMSYFLSVYMEWGVSGLWGGFSSGQIIIAIIYLYLLMHMDWEKAVFDV